MCVGGEAGEAIQWREQDLECGLGTLSSGCTTTCVCVQGPHIRPDMHLPLAPIPHPTPRGNPPLERSMPALALPCGLVQSYSRMTCRRVQVLQAAQQGEGGQV